MLHSLWQITLLWIVLVSIFRLWPKASSAIRYAMALATLTLAVLVTGATAFYQWDSYAITEEISLITIGHTQDTAAADVNVSEAFLSRIARMLNTSLPILAWLWCAGLVVMGTRFAGSLYYVRMLRAQVNTEPISPEWKRQLKRLSQELRLKSKVALATSARISSPVTLGTVSPIILLPAGLLSGLSTAQIEAILVHELYHIKRCDYVINVGQALIEVLLFYHPAIWHINAIIREERENICDDQTVAFCGDPVAYARVLTLIQEINTFTKPTLAMSATGPNPGKFTTRIKRLFHIYPDAIQSRSKGIFAIGFLIVYLGIVLVSAQVSTAQPPEPEISFSTSRPNVDLNNISRDSIPNGDREAPAPKEATREPVPSLAYNLQLRTTDTAPSDTALQERSLDECIDQVSIMLSNVHFGNPAVNDSLRIAASKDYTNIKLRPQAASFSGSEFQSTRVRLRSVDYSAAETPGKPSMPSFQEPTPLIIVNGVLIERTQNNAMLGKIDPTTIESISVYKNQDAIARYGEQGKDGVIDITLKAGTSMEEFRRNANVQVYPNSAKDRVNIRFTPTHDNTRVRMVLVNSFGEAVKEITDSIYDANPTELQLDVSGFEQGIYILQTDIEGAKSQQRIVVE